MSETILHDCKVLGIDSALPKSLIADSNGEYVIGYQYKCPLCNETSGELEPGPGIYFISGDKYTYVEEELEMLTKEEK